MLKTFGSHHRGNMVGSVALGGSTDGTRGITGIRRFACAAALAAFGALLWSASPASAVVVVHPTLVQTIATSSFTKPSPDPSGIVYRSARDRLLIGDSEVDETSLYQGANLFTATRTGSGFGSGTTLAFSKEPTDLGIKIGRAHV